MVKLLVNQNQRSKLHCTYTYTEKATNAFIDLFQQHM